MSDSIETKINTVLHNLEKYKETHPVFVKVWTLYLQEKLNNLKIVVSKCEQVSNSDLTNTPDLDAELLASLVTLF
jgi:hypothetical protein